MKTHVEYFENGNKKIEIYTLNNKRHREDGPAYISYYENGNIKAEIYTINDCVTKRFFYYENGKLEQEDYWSGEYPHYEVLHRIEGPAYINYLENGNIKRKEYFFEGEKLSLLQWMIMIGVKKGE